MQNATFRKYLTWVATLLIIINATKILNAQENQSLPYLYYYSGIVNAFIIERADGTDSRTLAQNVIPQHHNDIHQPIWSPSGQWLAWRSAEYGGLSPSFYSGWIISSDGSRRLTMLDHSPDTLVHVTEMEWASDEDLLFVSEIVADENRENVVRRTLLIDAETETELATYSFETTFPDDPIEFAWLPNNQGVAVLHRSYLQDARQYLLYLTLLLSDGTLRSATYPAEMSIGLSPDGKLAYIATESGQLVIENLFEELTQGFASSEDADAVEALSEFDQPAPPATEFRDAYPSPSGEYIGLTSSAIQQISTGITQTFSIHSAATYATNLVLYYDWHPDSAWVIATSNVTFAGCCGANAYTVLKADDPNHFRREITVGWGNNVGWLPQHVIAHLAEGQPESVLQQPEHRYRFDERVSGVTWSPDGNSILAVTQLGDVFLRDIHSSLQSPPNFSISNDCNISDFSPPCPVYWEGDRIIIGNQAWNTVQESFAPAENEDRVECPSDRCIPALHDTVSVNGRWLARVISRQLVEIVDQQSGEIIETFQVQDYQQIIEMAWVNDTFLINAAYNIIIFTPETGVTRILESVRSRGYANQFYRLHVSPDGEFVAGNSILNEIHIWEIETGELVTVLNWYAKHIAFSPDGRWLAAGNSDLVTIWDLSAFVGGR